jgi:hypothetical protein
MDFKPVKIIKCEARPNYHVWIRFNDGLEGEIDLSHLVGLGVFKAWEDISFFNSIHIDPISHTLAWGEDIELDSYVLYDEIRKHSK